MKISYPPGWESPVHGPPPPLSVLECRLRARVTRCLLLSGLLDSVTAVSGSVGGAACGAFEQQASTRTVDGGGGGNMQDRRAARKYISRYRLLQDFSKSLFFGDVVLSNSSSSNNGAEQYLVDIS